VRKKLGIGAALPGAEVPPAPVNGAAVAAEVVKGKGKA